MNKSDIEYLIRKNQRILRKSYNEVQQVRETPIYQSGTISSSYVAVISGITAYSQIKENTLEVVTFTELGQWEKVDAADGTQAYLSANGLDFLVYEESDDVKIRFNSENHGESNNYTIDFLKEV